MSQRCSTASSTPRHDPRFRTSVRPRRSASSSATIDRHKKLRIYARVRVMHAWLLDPLKRTLEVLTLESGALIPLVTHEGRSNVSAEPFAAIQLELGALWT